MNKYVDADSYNISSKAEWEEILRNHNCPYYPRYDDLDAEMTFFNIRAYFADKTIKPKFCRVSNRIKRLESKLVAKYRALKTFTNLSTFEKLKLRLDIARLERKLHIRRIRQDNKWNLF